MIKLEKIKVSNIECAMRGMRNPMNSWEKGDSTESYIGANDMILAKKLIASGSDHRKFLRQIFISLDITAPLYWWKEFDTYKISTVSNSCSTMHKLTAKEFELSDFSTENMVIFARKSIEGTIVTLNDLRDMYFREHKAFDNKTWWYSMIQLLPSSYNQKRTITMNYENALNMIHARKEHKLYEWKDFCNCMLGNVPCLRDFFNVIK